MRSSRISNLAAVLALACSFGVDAANSHPAPREKQPLRGRPPTPNRYKGMSKEQRQWNAAVDRRKEGCDD